PATSRPGVGPAPRPRAGCAPSPGSTDTPSKKTCSTTHPQLTCAVRLDNESHAVALDRNKVGALLVAAGLGSSTERAPISLLAINGLRISEALGGHRALGSERGARTLTVL